MKALADTFKDVSDFILSFYVYGVNLADAIRPFGDVGIKL